MLRLSVLYIAQSLFVQHSDDWDHYTKFIERPTMASKQVNMKELCKKYTMKTNEYSEVSINVTCCILLLGHN